MSARRMLALTLATLLLAGALARAEDPPVDLVAEKYAKTFLESEDEEQRIEAGLDLCRRNPDRMAAALDTLIKDRRKGDVELLATIAVRTRARHTRLLLVWAVSELKGTHELFLDRIDYDYMVESMAAIEAIGFLGDPDPIPKLMEYTRGDDELLAVAAARALCRLCKKKHLNAFVKNLLEVDTMHVRLHLVWGVNDIVGKADKAAKVFDRYARGKGTISIRAKDSIDVLKYDPPPALAYKVKLETVRKYFGPKARTKRPKIAGSAEETKKLVAALDTMEKVLPADYHLLCTAVTEIRIAKADRIINPARRIVSLRPSMVAKWDRESLYHYYLVQYSTILFLGMMGEANEGHRGWEEGVMTGWRWAMDTGKLTVEKDPTKFLEQTLQNPPW